MDEAVLERKYSRVDGRRRSSIRSSTIEPDVPSQDSKSAMDNEEKRKAVRNTDGNKVHFTENAVEVNLINSLIIILKIKIEVSTTRREFTRKDDGRLIARTDSNQLYCEHYYTKYLIFST